MCTHCGVLAAKAELSHDKLGLTVSNRNKYIPKFFYTSVSCANFAGHPTSKSGMARDLFFVASD